MEYSVQQDGGGHCVVMAGRFIHSDFAKVTQLIEELRRSGASRVTVNLGRVDFMDSGAIGMLLLIREQCGGPITLKGAAGQARQLLDNAHMGDLFHLAE